MCLPYHRHRLSLKHTHATILHIRHRHTNFILIKHNIHITHPCLPFGYYIYGITQTSNFIELFYPQCVLLLEVVAVAVVLSLLLLSSLLVLPLLLLRFNRCITFIYIKNIFSMNRMKQSIQIHACVHILSGQP